MRKEDRMTRIGIVGLGMLGHAVTKNLLDLKFQVTGYNRTASKSKILEEYGLTIASSPKEVAEHSDLLIIIVKDAEAVREVSFGENGIVKGNNQNLIVADMSTIDPFESVEISKKFKEFNIEKLDVPVMGGPNVAITGNLVMMASGHKESFEKSKKVLENIANKVFYLGKSGTGHSVKLAMNLQITMLALALSEGITFVKKSNVDPKLFLEILNSTYFKTGMSEKKAYKMIDGKYEPTFTLANLKKDISTITNASKSMGINLPMIHKAEEIYQQAIQNDLGQIDYTGIIEYITRINNK